MAIYYQLFFSQSSPSSPDPASFLGEDISTNSNGPKPAEVVLDDDREDLFAGNCKYLYFFLVIIICSIYPIRKYSLKTKLTFSVKYY